MSEGQTPFVNFSSNLIGKLPNGKSRAASDGNHYFSISCFLQLIVFIFLEIGLRCGPYLPAPQFDKTLAGKIIKV